MEGSGQHWGGAQTFLKRYEVTPRSLPVHVQTGGDAGERQNTAQHGAHHDQQHLEHGVIVLRRLHRGVADRRQVQAQSSQLPDQVVRDAILELQVDDDVGQHGLHLDIVDEVGDHVGALGVVRAGDDGLDVGHELVALDGEGAGQDVGDLVLLRLWTRYDDGESKLETVFDAGLNTTVYMFCTDGFSKAVLSLNETSCDGLESYYRSGFQLPNRQISYRVFTASTYLNYHIPLPTSFIYSLTFSNYLIQSDA